MHKVEEIYLWNGNAKIEFQIDDSTNKILEGHIEKICCCKDRLFIKTNNHILYFGEEQIDSHKKFIRLKKTNFASLDIASNNSYVFILTSDGSVLKIQPISLKVIETIFIKEESKYCSHGSKQLGKMLKISAIAVNNSSSLFVTDNGQLWASGNHPQIDINSEQPKKVVFFDRYIVESVTCGSNFYSVLVKKAQKVVDDDSDVDEVIVESCSNCQIQKIPGIISNGISIKKDLKSSNSDELDVEQSSNYTHNNVTNDRKTENEVIVLKENGLSNTESIKQFFTRQLSRVSSYGSAKDEIQMESIDNQPSLIMKKVSNMANLGYSSVKTVSSSSDVNNLGDEENEGLDELGLDEIRKPNDNFNSSTQTEDFPRSTSTGSSENELIQQPLSEKISILVNTGSTSLNTELWTWGDISHGQFGVGDTVNITRPREVINVNHCGVKKVVCGKDHTLALTLDGRVFIWGNSHFKQVAQGSQTDSKPPRLFTSDFFLHFPTEERVKDIAAADDNSLIMMSQKILLLEKQSSSSAISTLDIPTLKDNEQFRSVHGTITYSCCTKTTKINHSLALTAEQIYLNDLIIVNQQLISPFQKKSGTIMEPAELDAYDNLCQCHSNLLSASVLSVEVFHKYCEGFFKLSELIIISNVDEYVAVYKYYCKALCDVIAVGGFAQIASLVEVPNSITSLFKDKFQLNDSTLINEAIIGFALQRPMYHPNKYVNALKTMLTDSSVKIALELNILEEAIIKWDTLTKDQPKLLQEAENTKSFWEGCGKLIELRFKSPERRLIRESRSHQISLLNASRFSSHWFILLTDIFVHVSGSTCIPYSLPLLWIELLPDSDTLQNGISITTPEDTFVVYTPTAGERSDWFHALQNAINKSLKRSCNHAVPYIRTGSYSFVKHPIYKDANFTGQWLNGKLHGSGKLEWIDNRTYVGQFYKGAMQGQGRIEMPLTGIYEGQWKDGQQTGYGIIHHLNGDVYEGYFKDGLPHGYGMKKEGHFMTSAASLYIGEWYKGEKQGYGVIDHIKTGEKYLGSWSNNLKHGNGLIVTLDGVYYEGTFVQDALMGHGIMFLEDGTHYEGEFKSVGVFGGKGVLTFPNKEKLEGHFTGAWNEGVKVTATLYIHNKASEKLTERIETMTRSFGKLCAPPDQKWRSIFNQFYESLGILDVNSTSLKEPTLRQMECQRLWQNVAAIISKSQHSSQKHSNIRTNCLYNPKKVDISKEHDQLNRILYFDEDKLNIKSYKQMLGYLSHAFESPHHPLGILLIELADVYTATYGGVRVHPLLLEHAIAELRSITSRIYDIITIFFPALPKAADQFIIKPTDEGCDEEEVISAAAILHPILLPRVYSALFVLYALHNKKNDDAYWERLLKWNKQPNNTLLAFLGIDGKFWENYDSAQNDEFLNEAIETLQQLKTTFSAVEKLIVIKNTYYEIEQSVKKRLENYNLPADELIPIFYFVVVRASVLQLGSEINFIKDFMESYLMNGQIGYSFTTVMGIYDHILKEKISIID